MKSEHKTHQTFHAHRFPSLGVPVRLPAHYQPLLLHMHVVLLFDAPSSVRPCHEESNKCDDGTVDGTVQSMGTTMSVACSAPRHTLPWPQALCMHSDRVSSHCSSCVEQCHHSSTHAACTTNKAARYCSCWAEQYRSSRPAAKTTCSACTPTCQAAGTDNTSKKEAARYFSCWAEQHQSSPLKALTPAAPWLQHAACMCLTKHATHH